MYRPQKLVAALFSAALLCSTGIALADKGGNHDKHGGAAARGGSAPGQKDTGDGQRGASERGPGGIGGPRSSPGKFEQRSFDNRNRTDDGRGGMRGSQFEGSVDADASRRDSMDTRAGINVRLATGGTRAFDISDAALKSLKVHDGRSNLIFFTNGNQVTAIAARGEKCNMRVASRTGDTFTLQGDDGQARLITLDAKTANRLHVKVGSHLQVTTETATSGKILALDLMKKHDFDKFAPGRGTAAERQAAQLARMNAEGKTPPGLPHQCINPAGNTRGWCKNGDVDVAKVDIDRHDVDNDHKKLDVDMAKGNKADVDNDKKKLDIDKKKLDVDTKKAKKSDVDVAKTDVDVDTNGRGKCGHGKSRNGNPAFANQMAKDAANDASGHNPPGLPHECVNPAGHTRGFCKSASSDSVCGSGGASGGGSSEVAATDTDHKKIKSKTDNDVAGADVEKNGRGKCGPGKSRNGNPAYANQMAKDAANDASGHNPPGLPHECVNPAGHTRGFCKSSSSASLCGTGAGSGGGPAPSDVHGGIASASAPSPGKGGTVPAPANGGTAPVRGGTPGRPTPNGPGGGDRGPGAPVGVIPIAGGQFAHGSGTRGSTRGASPTHVLGASTRPTSGRHIAALPTRVLPVAIQPVGKRRCVWYKTGVLGASTGPYRIIGTSGSNGKPVLHKKCR